MNHQVAWPKAEGRARKSYLWPSTKGIFLWDFTLKGERKQPSTWGWRDDLRPCLNKTDTLFYPVVNHHCPLFKSIFIIWGEAYYGTIHFQTHKNIQKCLNWDLVNQTYDVDPFSPPTGAMFVAWLRHSCEIVKFMLRLKWAAKKIK
jgi:hypothetical protein